MENGEKCAFGFEGLTSLAEGLTKREYFAAAALQGFASSNPNISFGEQAKWAVISADKLIEELNKKAEL
jgi:hypothetical protein